MGDPAQDFAALMSGAAQAAAPAPGEAPYGWTTDRATGERRPKKVPGRPRARPPSVEELKAAADAAPDGPDEALPGPAPGDRAPDEKGRHRRGEAASGAPEPDDGRYVPGRIAKGMNRLYRRAGKIVKAFDPAVGEALIEVTRKDDDDDLTVGDAWEELARVNPRIRRFLMRLITGGAWGQLAAAHAPIILAVLMKPRVLEHIPFSRLIEALADRDEPDQGATSPTPPGAAAAQGLFAGLQAADVEQIAGLAQNLAANFRSRGLAPEPGNLQPAA